MRPSSGRASCVTAFLSTSSLRSMASSVPTEWCARVLAHFDHSFKRYSDALTDAGRDAFLTLLAAKLRLLGPRKYCLSLDMLPRLGISKDSTVEALAVLHELQTLNEGESELLGEGDKVVRAGWEGAGLLEFTDEFLDSKDGLIMKCMGHAFLDFLSIPVSPSSAPSASAPAISSEILDSLADSISGAGSSTDNGYDARKLKVKDLDPGVYEKLIGNLYRSTRPGCVVKPVLPEHVPSPSVLARIATCLQMPRGVPMAASASVVPRLDSYEKLPFTAVNGGSGSGARIVSSLISKASRQDVMAALTAFLHAHEAVALARPLPDGSFLSSGQMLSSIIAKLHRVSAPMTDASVQALAIGVQNTMAQITASLAIPIDFDESVWPSVDVLLISAQASGLLASAAQLVSTSNPPAPAPAPSAAPAAAAPATTPSTAASGPKPTDGFPSRRAAKRAAAAQSKNAGKGGGKGGGGHKNHPYHAAYPYPWMYPPPYAGAPMPAPAAAAPAYWPPQPPTAPPTNPAQPPRPSTATIPCKDFLKGACAWGTNCKFKH